MTFYLPVPGTHGWRGQKTAGKWWQPGSPFSEFMTSEQFEIIGKHDQYTWTTDIDGVSFWHVGKMRHFDWEAGGRSLKQYLQPPLLANPELYVPYQQRNIISHSHGGQVVLYACAQGLRIPRWISIMMPARGDMEDVIKAARPNIGEWWAVNSRDIKNAWQFIGTADFRRGFSMTAKHADVNDTLDDMDHNALLENPDDFYRWKQIGWLDFLRGTI